MKKAIMVIIAIGLLGNSMESLAAMSIKRLWQCGTAPDKNKCSSDETTQARGWLIGIPTAAVVIALAAFGITVSKTKVEQEKEKARTTQKWNIQESQRKIEETKQLLERGQSK